jgi:ATP-dependent DNA ligase
MLAKAVRAVPREPGLTYEPKWDGFRCVVFRDGDEIELGSRNDRPLTRYFPELVEQLRAALPPRCVVDGEIVLVTEQGLDFERLQLRLHPAASRVRKLAEETPASFVAFDLLALGDRDLTGEPFRERRRLLAEIVPDAPAPDGGAVKPSGVLSGDSDGGAVKPSGVLSGSRVRLTPLTEDPDVAEDWFIRFEGAGFDGVVAKAVDLPYEQDRRVMWKVKHERTADCVVAGFRWHKDGETVGSLLMGLYDAGGRLQHVGVASSFAAALRAELVTELAPLRVDALAAHPWREWAAPPPELGRMPRPLSRWSATKDLSWEPLRIERVAEVRYEHLQAGRFRHTSRLVRFRPDRAPGDCTYDQLDEAPPAELATLFGPSD